MNWPQLRGRYGTGNELAAAWAVVMVPIPAVAAKGKRLALGASLIPFLKAVRPL